MEIPERRYSFFSFLFGSLDSEAEPPLLALQGLGVVSSALIKPASPQMFHSTVVSN